MPLSRRGSVLHSAVIIKEISLFQTSDFKLAWRMEMSASVAFAPAGHSSLQELQGWNLALTGAMQSAHSMCRTNMYAYVSQVRESCIILLFLPI